MTGRRSVTRTVFASPTFLLATVSYVVGTLIGVPPDSPEWTGIVAVVIIAALTYAIERWYVTARAKIIVTQGIVDAVAAIRPELFYVCPEHGDACDVKCQSRQPMRRS